MITVTEEQDGSITIDWDPNDPKESTLNSWSEEDFVNAIRESLNDRKRSSEND
jgi:hypothetical protein